MQTFDHISSVQDAVINMSASSDKHLIWQTQRQVGKTTVLAAIAALSLISEKPGDIWFLTYNQNSTYHFLQKVIASLPQDEGYRLRKSRMEIVSNRNQLKDVSFFGKDEKHAQPKIILIDELGFVKVDKLVKLKQYLDVNAKFKFVATSGFIPKYTWDLLTQIIGKVEIFTSHFQSIQDFQDSQQVADGPFITGVKPK